jgi:hypothetical protein
MRPLQRGFADELRKLAFGSEMQRAVSRAQLRVARALVGVDPRVPTPFSDSRLDDEVSKMRLQQRLIELNRMAMGLEPEPGEEKTAMFGYVSPRVARRVVQNTGYDERDPAFREMARQLTGQSDLNRMSQYQLKALLTIMTGRPM